MIFLVGAVIAGVLLPSLVFAPEKVTSQSLETTVSHASSVTEPMSGNNAQAEVAESRPVAQIPASKPRTDKVASGEAKQAITAKPAVVKSGKKNGNPVVANKSPEPDHQSATASPVPAVEPAEKSGWDAFTQSIKHGSETKTCSDAERALNQCR